MDTAAQRDAESASYFERTAKGELPLRRCADCGHVRSPEVRACVRCHGDDFSWFAARGRGVLMTWAVLHKGGERSAPPVRAWVGMIELVEGPWIATPLAEMDGTTPHTGLEMEVMFVRPGDGEAIPAFRPVAQSIAALSRTRSATTVIGKPGTI